MVKFGKYEIINKIPIKGGSKEVFRGQDPDLGIDVAIKVLRDIEVGRLLRKGKTQVDLHKREPQILAKLNHPNIVRVFDAGIIERKPCIIEEWVGGGTLEERIGELNESQVITIGIQLTQALNYVYSELQQDGKPFLHRDLKPANVYFTEDGRVKLGDFALATSGDDTPPGSVYYLSPEQIPQLLGKEVESDERHEIFSLGVLLYQSLTGELPHIDNKFKEFTKGSDSLAHKENVLEQIKTKWDPHPRRINPNIPRRLDKLVAKMLSKNIENRPYMRGVQRELEKIRWWGDNTKKVVKGVVSVVTGILVSGYILYEMYKPFPKIPLDDRVLIVSKQDGDAEIYSNRRGVINKITNNEVDDQNIVPHPLGKRFTFERGSRMQRDVIEMDVNGEEIKTIASNKIYDEFGFSYNDDGSRGIYLSNYGITQTQVIVIEKDNGGEWKQLPPSFTGERVSKARLFIEEYAFVLQEDALKMITVAPDNQSHSIIDGCDDFEVTRNVLYYLVNGTLFVRDYVPGEPLMNFNLPSGESRNSTKEIGREIPQGAKLSFNQDRSILRVEKEDFVRVVDATKQTLVLEEEKYERELILKRSPDNLENALLILPRRSDPQIKLTHVIQAVECRVLSPKQIEISIQNSEPNRAEREERILYKVGRTVLSKENGVLGGEYFYFIKNNDPYRIHIKSQNLERLASTERRELEVALGNHSPNNFLFTTREDDGIYSISGERNESVNREKIQRIMEGVYIQLQTNKNGRVFFLEPRNPTICHLLHVQQDTQNSFEINTNNYREVMLNPHSNQILYVSLEQREERGRIIIVPKGLTIRDIDSGQESVIERDRMLKFCWSPDGSTVYYVPQQCTYIGVYRGGDNSKDKIFRRLRDLNIGINVIQIFGNQEGAMLLIGEDTGVMGTQDKDTNTVVRYNAASGELSIEGESQRGAIIVGER